MKYDDTPTDDTPASIRQRRRRAIGVSLATVLVVLFGGIGFARPAEAGAVFFRCSGGFVVTSSNSAMVVNDATWQMDVNMAVATLSDGSEVDLAFERVAGSRSRLEWVIGELPAGTISVSIRYGLSQHLPDGTVEYWGHPDGRIEHHAAVGAECVAPLPAGASTTTTPSTVSPTPSTPSTIDGGVGGDGGSTPDDPAEPAGLPGGPRPIHQTVGGGSLPITGSALVVAVAALIALLAGGGATMAARRTRLHEIS